MPNFWSTWWIYHSLVYKLLVYQEFSLWLQVSDKDLAEKILNLASLVAQIVKDLPAVQETWVQPLGWEDPLQKGMATHSSTFARTIPWAEAPGELQSVRL